MFDSTKLLPKYEHLLGWHAHFDTADIPSMPDLEYTESGEYYQDKHPALRLDYIKSTLSANQDLEAYLSEKVRKGINGIFNDLLQYRQVASYGKTLLEQAQLLNRYSWVGDKIVNQNRFVGLQIKVRDVSGLECVIDQLGLQLDQAQTVTMYLFHSTQEEAVATFDVTTTDTSTKWTQVDKILASMDAGNFNGGVFVIGYYQEDLIASAINYSNFNWTMGECMTCNGSAYYNAWRSIREHFYVNPLYVPQGSFVKGKMFNLQQAFYNDDMSWGLNLKFTVRCNLTDFFIQNRFAFKNILALKVTHMILNDMKFSQETSFVQESLKDLVIRDLEGDKETNYANISQQYSRELKAVTFNMSGINNRCLGKIEDTYQPVVGVL